MTADFRMPNYQTREGFIETIRQAGEYIADHAENLLGEYPSLLSEMDITARFRFGEVPTIEVRREYINLKNKSDYRDVCGIMESRDGTSIEEIVGEWLRANHYDGLCNPDAECGCSLDDLMPCGDPNPSGCLCGYEVPAPDGTDDQWFSVSSDEQNEPSDTLENATRDLYAFADEAINTGHHTKPKAALEGFRIRLAALGVNVDE